MAKITELRIQINLKNPAFKKLLEEAKIMVQQVDILPQLKQWDS